MKCHMDYLIGAPFILKWTLKSWKNRGLEYNKLENNFPNSNMVFIKTKILNQAFKKNNDKCWFYRMVHSTKANGTSKTTCVMVVATKYGRTDPFTKDTGKTIKQMAEAG